jgi:hypothetical protein
VEPCQPGLNPASPAASRQKSRFALRSPPPPLHGNHRSPLPPAPAAPEPPFEVENLCRGAQPDPQQSLRRQQRDVMAGGAIDLDEVALSEILDPRGVGRSGGARLTAAIFQTISPGTGCRGLTSALKGILAKILTAEAPLRCKAWYSGIVDRIYFY